MYAVSLFISLVCFLKPLETSDYSCGPPKIYTFTSTDTEYTVRCNITEDAVSENLEFFTVILSTSSQGVMLSPESAVYITDDDS